MELVGRRDWRMWREKLDLLNREKPDKNNNVINVQGNLVQNVLNMSREDVDKRITELRGRAVSTGDAGGVQGS